MHTHALQLSVLSVVSTSFEGAVVLVTLYFEKEKSTLWVTASLERSDVSV